MNCEEMRIDLPFRLRDELDRAKAEKVDAHLVDCEDCRNEQSGFTGVMPLLERYGVTVPSDLRHAVLSSYENERVVDLMPRLVERPGPHVRRSVMGVIAAEKSSVPARDGKVLRWRSRTQRVLAAAALVAAGAVGGYALTGSGPEGPTDLGGVPLGHETQVVALSGAGPGEASVRHYRHDNFRISFSVQGFPATPTGHHYAVWVRGPKGDVAVGTFRLQREDTFLIPFAVGVNPSDFPQLVVTLEPNDGDPNLTGEVITTGDFDLGSVHHGSYDE